MLLCMMCECNVAVMQCTYKCLFDWLCQFVVYPRWAATTSEVMALWRDRNVYYYYYYYYYWAASLSLDVIYAYCICASVLIITLIL